MKVVYGVSQKGNVICIIHIREMSEKPTVGSNTFHDPINAWQNRAGARTQPSLTPDVVI